VCSRIDPKGKRTLPIEANVCDPIQIERAVKKAVDRFGQLDMAVNNAGITGPAGIPVQDVDIDVWREVIDYRISGVFYCMKYEYPSCFQAVVALLLICLLPMVWLVCRE
jgi:NAD(P)-dependent dehydrogenase (short-subunit alcohol dehydrogenase family)